MNVYTCEFPLGQFVGGTSVIVAETELQAYELLRVQLIEQGFEIAVHGREKAGQMPTFQLLDTTKPQAIVLQNGGY